MTRRLPWKTSGANASPARTKSTNPASPASKVSKPPSAPATPAPPSQTPLKRTRRERDIDSDAWVRSPSTSPPPEVPVERFMIPLLDDQYRIVEDEFLNVAHQFTTHLHRAEYNRLKNLAKAQNAATIQEIERPVVGTPTVLAKQRKDGARRIVRQRKVAEVHGDECGGGSPDTETGLQGLLESPRKEVKWISASAAGTATTRAAAGFRSNLSSPPRPRCSPKPFSSSKKRQLPERDGGETESSHDLATPSRSRITKPIRTTQSASSATSRSITWSMSTPRAAGSSSVTNSPRPPSGASQLAATPSKTRISRTCSPPRENDGHNENEEEDEDNDPFGINKRRMIRKESREQFRKVELGPPPKKSSPDNIPSFI